MSLAHAVAGAFKIASCISPVMILAQISGATQPPVG
jgi:hypothetical protein